MLPVIYPRVFHKKSQQERMFLRQSHTSKNVLSKSLKRGLSAVAGHIATISANLENRRETNVLRHLYKNMTRETKK
jgi:hypothetical protein